MESTPRKESAHASEAKKDASEKLFVGLSRAELLIMACIIGAVILAYLPGIARNGYIWDDDDYVTENATLRSVEGLGQIWTKPGATPQYYPLTHTSFWIEYRIWKLSAQGYHFTNAVLHGCNALLLGLLLLRLGVPGAWFAAALFALHPVQVESVAWATERKNVLSACFYLAAAIQYVKFDSMRDSASAGQIRLTYAISLLLYMCALLSKTVTATLPAVLVILFWWKRGRVRVRDVVPLIPFFLIGLAMSFVTIHMEKHTVGAKGTEWSLSFLSRCVIAAQALWFYLWKLIVPYPLTFVYPRWSVTNINIFQGLVTAATGLLLVALIIAARRIGRAPAAFAALFIVTLLPALGFFDIFPMQYTFVADHYQYLACAAMFAAAGVGFEKLRRSRDFSAVSYGVFGVVAAVCFGLTVRQTKIYQNEETLWSATLRDNPTARIAHNNLGNLYLRQGQADSAVRHLIAAVELKPDDAMGRYNLANALWETGRHDEAVNEYQTALKLLPDFPDAENNLARAFIDQGRYDEGIAHAHRAIELDPGLAPAYNNIGNAYAREGRFPSAEKAFREALRLQPDYVEANYNLANVLTEQGMERDALSFYERAIRAGPNHAGAHLNFGIYLHRTGRLKEAADEYRTAAQLAPEWEEPRKRLGRIQQ